jgi:tetratricopeptide (TPR) repeat protein
MARVATGLLVAENDPDESFRHYRRALDLDPSNVSLSQEVARVHLQREEVPEALAVLKDALKLNPKSSSLALRIAGIYVVSLRKFEPAERYTRQALEADPDGIEPYQMLYSIYRADGRPAEAVSLLQEAARRGDNKSAAFWAGLGDLSVRQLVMDGHLRDSGKAAMALGHYRKASELGRQDPGVLLRALNFFFAGNHLEDAVATARRLLVLQPSDAQSREKLALALAALGRCRRGDSRIVQNLGHDRASDRRTRGSSLEMSCAPLVSTSTVKQSSASACMSLAAFGCVGQRLFQHVGFQMRATTAHTLRRMTLTGAT